MVREVWLQNLWNYILLSRVSQQNPISRRLHFIKNPFNGETDSSGANIIAAKREL